VTKECVPQSQFLRKSRIPDQTPYIGKENQDFLTKPAVWQGKSRFPYQTCRLVRKIKTYLPNLASGKENQDFLTKLVISAVAIKVKLSLL